MPKKSTTARSGAQRNRQKAQQKSIELVRSEGEEQKLETNTDPEPAAASVATATRSEEQQESARSMVPKGSAASRMAARRQASQKAQQRNAAALVTPEHFSYVRRDLITIAILAVLMFAIIIAAYFVLVARI